MGVLKHTRIIEIDVQLGMMNEWEILILEYYLSERTYISEEVGLKSIKATYFLSGTYLEYGV